MSGAQDATIAVMGVTGTGKSSFIQLLTGDENIRIGHGQESQTAQISTSRYFNPDENRFVTLVDTPGFDDSRDGVSDVDILTEIATFLRKEFSGGRKLSGVIYMHRISDPRMGGISRKNLRMFKQLCGDDSLKNVAIVTTNWNRVGVEEGEERENELRHGQSFFKPLIDAGAQLTRHNMGLTSARLIVSRLLRGTPIPLQIQVEMQDGRPLGETSAGSVLTAEIQALTNKYEKEKEELKAEMEEAAKAKDEVLQKTLKKEREDLERTIAKAESDSAALKRKMAEAAADRRAMESRMANAEADRKALERRMADADADRKRLEVAVARANRGFFERWGDSAGGAIKNYVGEVERSAELSDPVMRVCTEVGLRVIAPAVPVVAVVGGFFEATFGS